MEIINLLFKDIVPFVYEKEQDLVFLLKFTDYIFADLDLDIESEEEVQFFIRNSRIVNELYKLLGLTTNLTDVQRKAYDTEYLMTMLDQPQRLIKLKEFKVSLHRELDPELTELFEEYRKGKF